MSSPPTAGGLREFAVKLGTALGTFAMQEMMRSTPTQPSGWGQAAPTVSQPNPTAFQPFSGCPWCALAGDLGRAATYLEHARDLSNPRLVQYYVRRVRADLAELKSRLAVTPMDNDAVGSRINRLQLDLFNIDNPMAVGTSGQIESVLIDLSDLIDLAFQQAETPHMPTLPSQVVTVQPRPAEGVANGSGSVASTEHRAVHPVSAINADVVDASTRNT